MQIDLLKTQVMQMGLFDLPELKQLCLELLELAKENEDE